MLFVLVMIVLLGLELVTGSFALVPLARIEGKTSTTTLITNLSWVFLGNLIGSLAYGGLLYIALTMMGCLSQNLHHVHNRSLEGRKLPPILPLRTEWSSDPCPGSGLSTASRFC